MNTKVAMFPGSFDPPTLGHIDIIERCSKLYDKVFVVIAQNIQKHALFDAEERKSLLEESISKIKNVEVCIWNGLLVDFAKQNEIGVLIRGLRNESDFSYEFEVAQLNKQLLPNLEILFMPCDPKLLLVRSSSIKELASFGADIKSMVPKNVAKKISLKQKC